MAISSLKSPIVPDPFRDAYGGALQFRQIILYGAPGTGKSMLAQRLALALLSENPVAAASVAPLNLAEMRRFDDLQREGRVGLIVMRPDMGYEHFVVGVSALGPKPAPAEKIVRAFKCIHCNRPNKVRMPNTVTGPRLERGMFWKMCKQAEKRPVVLIMEEINRVDLAKLLGDLIFALDNRERPVSLPFEYKEGSDSKKTRDFKVPRNLYVIGTMNTADRSQPPMDVVMKRRFGLFQIEPDVEIVKNFWQNRDPKLGRQLATLMKRMNDALAKKDPEGDLRVGHAYFLADPELRDPIELRRQVARKWEHQVHQLLVEYDRLLNMGPDFFKRFPKRFE